MSHTSWNNLKQLPVHGLIIQRKGRASRPPTPPPPQRPPPLKNHKIGFLGNTGQDLLKKSQATKPAFIVVPMLSRLNWLYWNLDLLSLSTNQQNLDPSDGNFWIRECSPNKQWKLDAHRVFSWIGKGSEYCLRGFIKVLRYMLRDTAELLSSNESLFETHIIKIKLVLELLRVIVKLRHFPVTSLAWYHCC